MKNMKFSILYLGHLEFLKKHLIECGDDTETIQCHIPAVLIQHPVLGNILYDTGCSPLHNTEHSRTILENFPVASFISIEDALARKGLKPSDIDILIISHLHFDHAGGLKYFAKTHAIRKVYIAGDDLKQAYYSVMTGDEKAYCRSLFDVDGIRFFPISGTYPLANDITLFVQKCHTPGVIGLILRTRHSGTVIVTGDTIYTRESLEKMLPPGGHNSDSKNDFFVNCGRIKSLAEKENAVIFFGHDQEQVLDWTQKEWID